MKSLPLANLQTFDYTLKVIPQSGTKKHKVTQSVIHFLCGSLRNLCVTLRYNYSHI